MMKKPVLLLVALDAYDLHRLESGIEAGNLPPTSGFFFGANNGTETDDDRASLVKARSAIKEGKPVFYSSWR